MPGRTQLDIVERLEEVGAAVQPRTRAGQDLAIRCAAEMLTAYRKPLERAPLAPKSHRPPAALVQAARTAAHALNLALSSVETAEPGRFAQFLAIATDALQNASDRTHSKNAKR